jgi:hypothetical protein
VRGVLNDKSTNYSRDGRVTIDVDAFADVPFGFKLHGSFLALLVAGTMRVCAPMVPAVSDLSAHEPDRKG